MRIKENATFVHTYAYTLLDERPGVPGLTYFYPGARTDSGRDGILVRFRHPNARPWIGIFAPLDWLHYHNGVYAHPDPGCFCVVSGGAGYIVCVEEPTHHVEVDASPITDVHVVASHGLLVFATFVTLAAYGAHGKVWETGRLALDAVHITSVDASSIHGRANRIDSTDVGFNVDLRTGVADVLHPW